jgi:hypothetical protein
MAEPIRVYCDDPDYADTWIDIAGRWTLAEQRRMVEVADDDFWSFLRAKTIACHIETGDGATITDPDQISGAGLADVDVLVIGWLGSVLPLAIAKRKALGNASARLSLPRNGANPMRTPTATAAPEAG